MSPVERTAAWVLNNGQYEEVEEDTEQNPDEAKHAEKVPFILYGQTRGVPAGPAHPRAGCRAADRCSHARVIPSEATRLCGHSFVLHVLSHSEAQCRAVDEHASRLQYIRWLHVDIAQGS